MALGTRIRAETKNALVATTLAVLANRPQRLVYSLAKQAYDLVSFDAQQDREESPEFDGETYNPALDHERLNKQIGRVYSVMESGRWLSLNEICSMTGDPPASVSARLRDLRKPKFGAYLVARRPRGDREKGLFEYRLLAPDGQALVEWQG